MVSLYIACHTIVCIVPWCLVVYKTSTASIQSVYFIVTEIPFCFSELLISFVSDLEVLRAIKTAWDFWGLLFGPGNFGVLLEAVGTWLLASFDHPRHLKSRTTRVPAPIPPKHILVFYCTVHRGLSFPFTLLWLPSFDNLGNWSKQLFSNQTHLWGRRGGFQRHHLSSNITNNILLAFKFELTQEYSASKSRHY